MRRFTSYEAEPAQIMRAVVKAHGKQIFLSANKNSLAEILRNSYENHAELLDILQKAVDFGIPAELLKLYAKNDREQSIRVIVRRFAEKYDFSPEAANLNQAVSCFTFALDYGMFDYSIYPRNIRRDASEPVYISKIIQTDIVEPEAKPKESPQIIELKDIVEDNETETFVDFKTWFEKKQVKEKELNERDINNIYIKSADDNYYKLEQTDHLIQTGDNFHALYENFDAKKKEREIIKMGMDICAELETSDKNISLKPSDIFRDKYGNYRLNAESQDGGNQNNAQNLGQFMRELLGVKIDNEILSGIVKKSSGKKYGDMSDMKKDLEYAFELALDEWLFAGTSPQYVLTEIKAKSGEFTNENIFDVSVPDKYASVGARAFIRRESLRSVIIPSSVENIAGFAFGWCKNLENVTVEDGENINDINIGSFAFWGCENLKKVTMRGTFVKNLGNCAFYGCRKLRVDIYGDIDGDAESLIDGAFFGARDTEANIYTGGKRKSKRYDRIFNNRIQFY